MVLASRRLVAKALCFKWPLSCLIFTGMLMIVGCESEEPPLAKIHPLYENYDEYFNALTSLGDFNGVILVEQRGEPVILKAYNISTDTTGSLHVTTTSQFDIHSVSKLMAHYLFLQLVGKGVLSTKDKLSRFIPDFPRGDEISMQMLIEHKSGLPRELTHIDGPAIDLDVEQMVEQIKHEELLFEPGSEVQYSNLGYQLLYYIIGRVNGSAFEDFLANALFIPLRMNSSGAHFHDRQNNLRALAANHEVDGDTIVWVENILDDEFKQARIYSTAEDLIRLLREFQKEPLAHGLAEDSIIQHSGGSDGVRAHVYCDLKSQSSFVLLSNFDGIPFNKTIADMINILEGNSYDIPKAINRVPVAIEPPLLPLYIGNYHFADMNDLALRVALEGDRLIVFQEDELIANLMAENDSVFFADPSAPESFEFVANDKGSYNVLMGWRGVKLLGVREEN
jgi:hypothetical protein